MLNISAAPQIKSSADNPITISDSGSGKPQGPETEEFAKVLQREVSETTSKRETNNAATTPDSSESTTSPADSDTVSTATTDASGTNSLINNLFIEAANTYTADQSLLPLDPTSNPDTLTTTSILSMALSTLSQNAFIPQDNELATSPTLLTSQMLQQKLAQTASATSNLTYSPNDFWQSMDTADSAAYGKLLPFPSETSETIQINTGESIFSAPNEPISTQAFGLSNITSVTPLNTTPQNAQVDLPVGH